MRRKEIDWLRNGAVLMLFIFHTSVIFDSFEKDFYVRSVTHGLAADVFMLITFFWYMPLLFFLAGASAHFSLAKRTNRKFLKERVTRLLIPFLFGVLIVIPPQGYFAKLWHSIPTGGYLNHWIAFFTHVTDFSGNDGNLTPGHLWFILFLFLISALLLPLLRCFEQKKWAANSLENQASSAFSMGTCNRFSIAISYAHYSRYRGQKYFLFWFDLSVRRDCLQ